MSIWLEPMIISNTFRREKRALTFLSSHGRKVTISEPDKAGTVCRIRVGDFFDANVGIETAEAVHETLGILIEEAKERQQ